MKIKGVEIEIGNSGKPSSCADLGKAVSLRADIYANEAKLRVACAAVLKRAKRDKKKNVVFFADSDAFVDFPPVACAKILAQEIYRHIKEDKPVLKKICVNLGGYPLSKVFKKTLTGYLDHLLNVLTQGPLVTVDTIIKVKGGIVLIKRSNPPFGWALPGGFVDYGESLEEAAYREAYEETGLKVKNLRQMHTYSKPGRDPRFQTITTVFVCQADGKPVAASDAAQADIFNSASWKSLHLAFDHAKVLSDYLKFK